MRSSTDGGVEVTIPPGVAPHEIPRTVVVPVSEVTPVETLILRMSQECDVWFKCLLKGCAGEEGIFLLVVDGKAVYPDDQKTAVVRPGDCVHIIPPISGG